MRQNFVVNSNCKTYLPVRNFLIELNLVSKFTKMRHRILELFTLLLGLKPNVYVTCVTKKRLSRGRKLTGLRGVIMVNEKMLEGGGNLPQRTEGPHFFPQS